MQVRLARTAGFCMGVKRAIQVALDTARQAGSVVTCGPLVHNPQAVAELATQGVVARDDYRDIEVGTLIIRAHGMPVEEVAALRARGLVLVDATCPHVQASQRRIRAAAEAGAFVVIVGDRDHPEIKSLASYAAGGHAVVGSVDEVARLPAPADLGRMPSDDSPRGRATPTRRRRGGSPEPDPCNHDPVGAREPARDADQPDHDAPRSRPVVVIAQTTFNADAYDRIAAAIRARYGRCTVHASICRATSNRQEEVLRLAGEVEAVVVVGGRNSANTRRLAELAAGTGRPTVHVETADELDPAFFDGICVVGVTAGASTPTWITRRVVETLAAWPADGRHAPGHPDAPASIRGARAHDKSTRKSARSNRFQTATRPDQEA